MIVSSTQRLILREMTEADAGSAYDLNLDPEVIRYTGDPPFESIDSAREFLKNYDHYKKYGFGRWAVFLKENEEFIGWCGLKYTPSVNEYDVGFRFHKKFWNKGYATESAMECLNLGFGKFGMSIIVGRAMKENKASIKVLEKCGLRFWRSDNCGGEEGVIYRISAEQFQIQHGR